MISTFLHFRCHPEFVCKPNLIQHLLPAAAAIIIVTILLAGVRLLCISRGAKSTKLQKDIREGLDAIFRHSRVPATTSQAEVCSRTILSVQEDAPVEASVTDLIDDICSDNLRELVKDRDETLAIRVEEWALNAVDIVDELRRLPEKDPGGDQYIRHLLSLLSAMDCELIDCDVWNPEKQRAVQVQSGGAPGSVPRITRKISTGLLVRGKLVRKQEVIIEKAF